MAGALRFTPPTLVGTVVIDGVLREDDRGYFSRSWCIREFAEQGIDFVPVQASTSFNRRKGTLRGMHLQVKPALEAKLVHCTKGSLYDVVLDVRPDSPSYGKWCGIELRGDKYQMLYIPEGCAHGYVTLEDDTEIFYMMSQYYTPGAYRGVRYDDPVFGIDWPMVPTTISEQDRNWPLVTDRTVL